MGSSCMNVSQMSKVGPYEDIQRSKPSRSVLEQRYDTDLPSNQRLNLRKTPFNDYLVEPGEPVDEKVNSSEKKNSSRTLEPPQESKDGIVSLKLVDKVPSAVRFQRLHLQSTE
jgi:hypothetical protein